MFFQSKQAMQLSSRILCHPEILKNIYRINHDSLSTTKTEVTYFRDFFPRLQEYLNSLNFDDFAIQCQAVEVHRKPIVKINSSERCELGDSFINVKYIIDGETIGKKLTIYQYQYSKRKPKWTIKQKQLKLLRDWPTFAFGNMQKGIRSFSLRPKTPYLGSYCLGIKNDQSFYFPGLDIDCLQSNATIDLTNQPIQFLRLSSIAIFHQMAWRIGEPVYHHSDLHDFLDALYRFVQLYKDPPEEFYKFQTVERDSASFWGLEICISTEQSRSVFKV